MGARESLLPELPQSLNNNFLQACWREYRCWKCVCICVHVKMGVRDNIHGGRLLYSGGKSLWAEAYMLIRCGIYTLYLSSAFLLRHFLHITDIISFVISIVLTT